MEDYLGVLTGPSEVLMETVNESHQGIVEMVEVLILMMRMKMKVMMRMIMKVEQGKEMIMKMKVSALRRV